jgi:hypothetical protein
VILIDWHNYCLIVCMCDNRIYEIGNAKIHSLCRKFHHLNRVTYSRMRQASAMLACVPDLFQESVLKYSESNQDLSSTVVNCHSIEVQGSRMRQPKQFWCCVPRSFFKDVTKLLVWYVDNAKFKTIFYLSYGALIVFFIPKLQTLLAGSAKISS